MSVVPACRRQRRDSNVAACGRVGIVRAGDMWVTTVIVGCGCDGSRRRRQQT